MARTTRRQKPTVHVYNYTCISSGLETCLHRQTSLDLIVLSRSQHSPYMLRFILTSYFNIHFQARVVFLQNKIELFVNRLNSVKTVLPFEYSRYWFILMSLFACCVSVLYISEDKNPSCDKHPLPYTCMHPFP